MPNISQYSQNSKEGEERLKEPDGLGTPAEHDPQNQLSQDNRSSQRLKQQPWNLHGSAPGLCIHAVVL